MQWTSTNCFRLKQDDFIEARVGNLRCQGRPPPPQRSFCPVYHLNRMYRTLLYWLPHNASGSIIKLTRSKSAPLRRGPPCQQERLLEYRAKSDRRFLMSSSILSKSTSSTTPDPTLLKDLANSIDIDVGKVGHVTIGLCEGLSDQRFATVTKKQKVQEEAVPVSVDSIPDSVLQYERQLRKIQATQRSVAELSMEEHLRIVYEDSDLIVVDKPSGVLCVPGINNKPNILQLVCQYLSEKQKTTVEPKSDMIAHRLDMDTSGLVVFCKNTTALKALQATFRDRKVAVKEYHALLCGHIVDEWKSGSIHLPLQRDHRHPPFMRVATPRSEAEAHAAVQDLQTHGFKKLIKKAPKPSHTEFRILEREYLEFPNPLQADDKGSGPTEEDETTVRIPVTRVALTPHTGRTHQLRVHCAAMGYPIVGDPAYGLYGEAHARGGVDETNYGSSLALQEQLSRCRPSHSHTMCLHAAKLGIDHPISGEQMLWTASTPF